MLSYAVKGVIVLLLIILAYLYFPFHGPDDIRSFINSYGVASPIVFIVVCIIRPVIFFLLAMGLTIIAGTLFGPLYGTLYVALGGAGSTIVGFYMTRLFGRKVVERFLNGRKGLLEIDEKMQREGFKTVLMLRLFSLPWDLVSYSAGLSGVSFKDFYKASIVALVPTSLIYTYFGSTILYPLSLGFMISLSIIIILGCLPYVFKRPKSA